MIKTIILIVMFSFHFFLKKNTDSTIGSIGTDLPGANYFITVAK